MKGLRYLILSASIGIAAAQASATIYTLTDTNTSATVDTSSNLGLKDWIVGGIDQVHRNTYAWRVGDSTIADAIQNLTELSSGMVGTRFLNVAYGGTGFRIDITYVLTGGATSFDIAEIVRVTNTGNAALPFRLFQYNDFDLMSTANDDTVTRINSSQMEQTDGVVAMNVVSQGATPVPGRSQLGPLFFSSPLTNTAGYNLDTTAGNGLGQSSFGDVAYGFQWNFNLNPGQSFTISTDKVAAVPEPGTMAALGLGAIALLRRRRKK